MRKIAVKILTILLVVSAAILVLSGCASLDVQLDRDGSGTATLTLSKEEGVTKDGPLPANIHRGRTGNPHRTYSICRFIL